MPGGYDEQLHVELALKAALGEDAEDALPEIRDFLHEKQKEFFDCTERLRTVLGGRQGGKSFVLAAWLIDGALKKDRVLCMYLGLTMDGCRDSVWPEMVYVCELLGLEEYIHEHILTIGPFPNGSIVKCKGSDDRRSIENRRGAKPYRLAVDEMGSQDPAWIQYFVVDILWPALIKNRGQVALGGTPGLVMDGYWYDLTGDESAADTPVFRWTAWDNPHLGTPEEVEEFVEEFLSKNALTRESVTYLREWRAVWTEDMGALVYPYNREKNSIDALPEITHKGYAITGGWRVCIGVDVGATSATAFVVVASNESLPDTYILHSEKHENMGIQAFEAKLQSLRRRYDNPMIVIDTGGMGKVHANELTSWSTIPFQPAQKSEKASAIRLFRDRLIAGRIKLLNDTALDPLRQEWAKLGWDKKQLQHDPEGEDHAADACLYAEKALRHYRSDENRAKPKPLPGSREELEEWEKQSELDEIRKEEERTSKRRRPMWDV